MHFATFLARYRLHAVEGEVRHQTAAKEAALQKVAALHIECTEVKDELSRANVAHINALAEANLESTQRDKERARAEFIDIKLKSTEVGAEIEAG